LPPKELGLWFRTRLAIENPLVGFKGSVASDGKGLGLMRSGARSGETSAGGRSGDEGRFGEVEDGGEWLCGPMISD